MHLIGGNHIEVSFAASDISSDGGLLSFQNIESHTGIIKAVAKCIGDTRHHSYVNHSLEEIAAQRVYQIVDGYEDANNCNTSFVFNPFHYLASFQYNHPLASTIANTYG